MTWVPVRFGQGQGLVATHDEQLQGGLLDHDEVDVLRAGVAQKRPGADEIDLDLASGAIAVADQTAVWWRDDELCLAARGRLYSRDECADPPVWRDRGAWPRVTLREVESARVDTCVACAVGVLGDCRIELIQTLSDGLIARFYGERLEAEVLVDADGSDPKIAPIATDEVVVSWVHDQSGTPEIRTGRWVAGATALTGVEVRVSNSELFAVGGGQQVWDLHGSAEYGLVCWVWFVDGLARALRFERQNGTTANHTSTVAFRSSQDACSVHIGSRVFGASVQVWAVWIAHSTLPTHQVLVEQIRYDLDTDTPALDDGVLDSRSWASVEAVAIGPDRDESANFWLGVQVNDGGSRQVNLLDGDGGGAVNRETEYPRGLLQTQASEIDGQAAFVVTPYAIDPADLAASVLLTNSQLLVVAHNASAPTLSVAGRSWLSESLPFHTGAFTPPPTNTICRVGTKLAWAVPRLESPTDVLTVSAAVSVADAAYRADRPPVVAGVAASAFGGYPRAYDGEVYEADWHELPGFLSAGTFSGSLPAGTYSLAVTYSYRDRSGLLARSAPSFATVTCSGSQAITVEVSRPVWTERDGDRVAVEVWCNSVTGPTEYRRISRLFGVCRDPANVSHTVNITSNPADFDTEVLDLATVGGEQGVVTDFLTSAGDRLWGRSPRYGHVAVHSLFDRSPVGEARRWSLSHAVGYSGSTQEPVTAVVELDGRIALGSAGGWYRVDGTGPSDAGAGVYGAPIAVPSEQGPVDAVATETGPDGVLYAAQDGAYLLTRGLATARYTAPVERIVSRTAASVVALVRDPGRRQVVLGLDSGGALAVSGGRWARWTSREVRQAARSQSGYLAYLLSDGRVLRDDGGDLTADGATGYGLLVGTPWIRADPASLTTHHVVELVQVLGERLGPDDHELVITEYRDWSSTPVASARVTAAQIAAAAAAGLPYLYRWYRGGAAGVRLASRYTVEVTSTTGTGPRIVGIDLDVSAVSQSVDASLVSEHCVGDE